MAGVLQAKETLHPRDNFVAGRAGRLVQVYQAKPDVLIDCPLVRRAAIRWVCFVVYPSQ